MNFLKKNPVLCYFALTFLISWGAILVLIALNGMPATVAEAQRELPIAILFLSGRTNHRRPAADGPGQRPARLPRSLVPFAQVARRP